MAFDLQTREYTELQAYQRYWAQTGDLVQAAYYQRLLSTANRRYDFGRASLNDLVAANLETDWQPSTFGQWLASIWRPN